MKLPHFFLIATVSSLAGLTAQAQNYGIHFVGNTVDPVTAAAGVVPLANYNNITQAAATFAITDSSGLNPATLTLAGPGAGNGFSNATVGNGGNNSLMHGYLDSGGTGGAGATGTGTSSVTLTLSNLTSPSYDLYVYTLGDAPRPGNLGDGLPQYTVNGTNYFAAIQGGAFSGTFVRDGTQSTQLTAFPNPNALTAGNYLLVQGVTPVAGTITLVTNADNRTFRSPVNGLQLIAVPEPSTTAIAALGLLGAVVVMQLRRRATAA